MNKTLDAISGEIIIVVSALISPAFFRYFEIAGVHDYQMYLLYAACYYGLMQWYMYTKSREYLIKLAKKQSIHVLGAAIVLGILVTFIYSRLNRVWPVNYDGARIPVPLRGSITIALLFLSPIATAISSVFKSLVGIKSSEESSEESDE